MGEMNDEKEHSCKFKFRDFRLDVAERLLLRNGVSVSLPPKMFDVLAALVERSGHLVEKDELLRIVWEDTFVEESNIARIVHSLRKILGENGERKFIETVSKKGYRFVAEVKEIDGLMPFRNVLPVKTEIAVPKYDGNHFLHNGDNFIKPNEPNSAPNIETVEEIFPENIPNRETPTKLSSKRSYKFLFFGAIAVFAITAFGIWFYKNSPPATGENLQKKINRRFAASAGQQRKPRADLRTRNRRISHF